MDMKNVVKAIKILFRLVSSKMLSLNKSNIAIRISGTTVARIDRLFMSL